jgi:hypothetical protein
LHDCVVFDKTVPHFLDVGGGSRRVVGVLDVEVVEPD